MSVSVGHASTFEDRKPYKFTIDGTDVLVASVDDKFFAVNDICTHSEVSLSEGTIEGCAVECWLHGATFDLQTGEPAGPPATTALATYSVTLGEGSDPEVLVNLNESARN